MPFILKYVDATGRAVPITISPKLKLGALMVLLFVGEAIMTGLEHGSIVSWPSLVQTARVAFMAAIPVIFAYFTRSGAHQEEVAKLIREVSQLDSLVQAASPEPPLMTPQPSVVEARPLSGNPSSTVGGVLPKTPYLVGEQSGLCQCGHAIDEHAEQLAGPNYSSGPGACSKCSCERYDAPVREVMKS